MEKPNFNTNENNSTTKHPEKKDLLDTSPKSPFDDLGEVYNEEIQKDKEMFETKGINIKEVSEKDATPNEHGEHDLPWGITP